MLNVHEKEFFDLIRQKQSLLIDDKGKRIKLKLDDIENNSILCKTYYVRLKDIIKNNTKINQETENELWIELHNYADTLASALANQYDQQSIRFNSIKRQIDELLDQINVNETAILLDLKDLDRELNIIEDKAYSKEDEEQLKLLDKLIKNVYNRDDIQTSDPEQPTKKHRPNLDTLKSDSSVSTSSRNSSSRITPNKL